MKPEEFSERIRSMDQCQDVSDAMLRQLSHLACGVGSASALIRSLEGCLAAGLSWVQWLNMAIQLPDPEVVSKQILNEELKRLENDISENKGKQPQAQPPQLPWAARLDCPTGNVNGQA